MLSGPSRSGRIDFPISPGNLLIVKAFLQLGTILRGRIELWIYLEGVAIIRNCRLNLPGGGILRGAVIVSDLVERVEREIALLKSAIARL